MKALLLFSVCAFYKALYFVFICAGKDSARTAEIKASVKLLLQMTCYGSDCYIYCESYQVLNNT